MANLHEITYTPESETQNLITEVIDSAYQSVVGTMGPNGKVALIIEKNKPIVTKDGVRVAKALDFNELRKNKIAELITSSAIRTDEMIGDGTTTTVLMIHGLYNAFKNSSSFATINLVSKLVKESKAHLLSLVKKVTPDSEEFRRMILTTANYEEDIADLVVKLYRDLPNPNIVLSKSRFHSEDNYHINRDITFDGKYWLPELRPNTPKNEMTFPQCKMIVVDNRIEAISPQLQEKLLSLVSDGLPLIIVGRDFDQPYMDLWRELNRIAITRLSPEKRLPLPLFIPYTLDASGTLGSNIFKDMCEVLNVPKYNRIDSIIETDALDIVPTPVKIDYDGIHLDGENEVYKERAEQILSLLVPAYEESNVSERASLLGIHQFDRISRLRGTNVQLNISGMTDSEITERYYLYEDAVKAAASSLLYGVLPGIGWGYVQTAQFIYNEYVKGKPFSNETKIAEYFSNVLLSQYNYLNPESFMEASEERTQVLYHDLVSGLSTEVPDFVFDNGAAAVAALEGAWSTVQRLIKMHVILGKSNNSYKL